MQLNARDVSDRSLTAVDSWLAERLPALINEGQVPAASVAVLANDMTLAHAVGVLNKSTGVEATTDSIFQIGSITKVWTATLAMQLVERGVLDLNAPVRQYLPSFRIADEFASRTVTVRQLTCHTGGFEGDFWAPLGWGDDVVQRLVDSRQDTPQTFPPGRMFSYNNLGFTVLGRIIEVLCDSPFDDCLRDQLLQPLGITHAAATPWEAILHRSALGHVSGPGDPEPRPAATYSLPRSDAPAGALLAMRAEDLISFARMHLREGFASGGARVLAPSLAAAMQQPQVRLPAFHGSLGLGDRWGIGWAIHDCAGGPVIAHPGSTIGQSAFLALVPRARVAVAVLTNGGRSSRLHKEVTAFALGQLAGVEFRDDPVPPRETAIQDASRYCGVYSHAHGDTTVQQDSDGRVWMTSTIKGPMLELYELLGQGASQTGELLAFEGDVLLTSGDDAGPYSAIAFLGDDGQGRAQYLQSGMNGRVIRRAEADHG